MRQITFGENKNIIGESLRQRRRAAHLSQMDLAARMQTLGVNIDQQMISRIERNSRQVTDYEFACFCLCLHTDPNELLASFFDGMK